MERLTAEQIPWCPTMGPPHPAPNEGQPNRPSLEHRFAISSALTTPGGDPAMRGDNLWACSLLTLAECGPPRRESNPPTLRISSDGGSGVEALRTGDVLRDRQATDLFSALDRWGVPER